MLLSQTWIKVRQDRGCYLERIYNHAMAVVSTNRSDKLLIFGGVGVKKQLGLTQTFLSNHIHKVEFKTKF